MANQNQNLDPTPSLCRSSDMNPMIHIRVTPEEAHVFIGALEKLGYKPVHVPSTGRVDVHFLVAENKDTTYSVTVFEFQAFIGVRPPEV